MLYIRQLKKPSLYEVYDTDDGSVDLVDDVTIEKALNSGLTIEGIKSYTAVFNGKETAFIDATFVYQPPETIKPWQTKLKVLYGVDIKVVGDKIVDVSWDGSKMLSGMRLRLSDFAKQLGSCAFWNEINLSPLIFVLDDKLTYEDGAITGFFVTDGRLDISDLSDVKLVETIYNEFFDSALFDMAEYIIDKPERFDIFSALHCMSGATNYSPRSFSETAEAEVLRRYGRQMLEVAQSKFRVSPTNNYNYAKTYFESIIKNAGFWYGPKRSYEEVKKNDVGVCVQLGFCTNLDRVALSRLCAYIIYFNVTPKMRVAYIDFCYRANRLILDFGRSRGWG